MNTNMFTRSKGGTAEREELISQIEVPDLWHLIQAMKQGTTISKKEGQRLVASIEECWHLAHDMKRHMQDTSTPLEENDEPAYSLHAYEEEENWLQPFEYGR
jgi:hypothetical protein|tara:strand:- start:4614 stop:4919 length:306 start_codon:yes stop_codon:yes gene_type:complete